MVNNGSLSYDHDRDGTHTMLGGCQVKFRNKVHETVVAVRYEGDRLTLSHDFDNRQPSPFAYVSMSKQLTGVKCLVKW